MTAYGTPTVVSGGRLETLLLWVGFPLAGGAAGAGLAAGAGWIAGLSWAPAQGLFRLLDRMPDQQALAAGAAVGVLAGLVFGAIGTAERVTVTVTTERVRVRRGSKEREFARRDVRVGHLDGKELVLLGPDDEELVRQRSDLPGADLAGAFRAHGWPWADEDPHRTAYRLWVPELPGLPPGADALLKARQRALDDDRGDEAGELRTELARYGVVVRDEGKRQHWRLSRSASPPQ
ncbi:YqeB family protein [Micromonospora sp. NPDC003241]